jgi:hypothetical protein
LEIRGIAEEQADIEIGRGWMHGGCLEGGAQEASAPHGKERAIEEWDVGDLKVIEHNPHFLDFRRRRGVQAPSMDSASQVRATHLNIIPMPHLL